MPLHGYPDHSGNPSDYDDARDQPQCAVCGTEDDPMPYGSSRTLLCVKCESEVREEEERDKALAEIYDAVPEPAPDDEDTTEVPVETMEEVVSGGRR